MVRARLLIDTNVIVDYLNMRKPFYDDARKLMILTYLGEFEAWISASQMTDLVYTLSEGGKATLMPQVLERLRGLRKFVNVYAAGESEIDRMLATSWSDPEDALMHEIALALKADAIITRDQADFENSLIRVMDCTEFFEFLSENGTTYEGLDI